MANNVGSRTRIELVDDKDFVEQDYDDIWEKDGNKKTLSDTKIDRILHHQRANAQNEVVLAEEQTNQRCFDGEPATSVKKLNLLVFVSVIAAWRTVSRWWQKEILIAYRRLIVRRPRCRRRLILGKNA